MKIRKVHRKKKFRVNMNRKRLRNRLRKLPTIKCDELKNAWEITKSTRNNLRQMGLAYDPNEVLKIPNTKKQMIEEEVAKAAGQGTFLVESIETDAKLDISKDLMPQKYVAELLESDARAPRQRLLRLPKNQVNFLMYLMDKYEEDYEAMAKDKKNYYQMTWKQIRSKINQFKKIPEQYNQYLAKKT